MIFSGSEAEFIAGILKWYTYQHANDAETILHSAGTLDRLTHGGLHIRDLQAIHKALTLSANQDRDADQCLPLIVEVSQLMKDAPPYPQPVTAP